MERHQAHPASGTSCELGSCVALAGYFFGRMLSLSFSICKTENNDTHFTGLVNIKCRASRTI